MALPKKAWVKRFGAVAVRKFAADQVNPITVSNPFYARKLFEDAKTIALQKRVLNRSSFKNRVNIQRGIAKNQFKYRSKVIFWSLKNALRAVDISLIRRREIMPILVAHADFLVFTLPSSMRRVRDTEEFSLMGLKQRRYAQAKMDEAIDRMYHTLDAKIGVKKRRELFHYFTLLYEGGQTYRQAVEADMAEPEE